MDKRKLKTKNSYLASKIREHLNSVGYDLSLDTEKIIQQVLNVDGKSYDNLDPNTMIRDRARLMLEAYTNLGKRDTKWEMEYHKGIQTLVNDIMKLTDN